MSKQTEALRLALEALEHGLVNTAPVLNYDGRIISKAITAIREALAEQPAQQQYQSTADKCELTPVPAKGGLLPAQQEPDCPKCGNNRQVWDNQITGKKTCHRVGCHQEIEQPAQDNTYGYAKNLAEAIFKQHFASDEHYASGRIVWGVNDTVIGILTQIDNMVADMVRRPAQQESEAVHAAWMAGYTEGEREAIEKQIAQQQEPVAKDAEEWGARLNQASWAAVEAWNQELMGPMSGAVFNNIKGVVRAAILKYVEGYTSPPASKPWVGLTDEDVTWLCNTAKSHEQTWGMFVRAIEVKLREKNA